MSGKKIASIGVGTLLVIGLLLVALDLNNEKVRDRGYAEGYDYGVAVTEKRLNDLIELQAEKIRRLERQSTTYSGAYSTEVCGGNGVNVNGKHHSAGKTGCVRVYSDGRIEKY